MNDWIDALNDIADRIYEHLEAGGGILDENDHDNFMQDIRDASEDAQGGASNAIWAALTRAKQAMQKWNDEEYPYCEDLLSDMHPDGIDNGYDYYDEE